MKIYLLLWKDLKILSANKWSLFLQFVTPLLICSMLLVLRSTSKPIDITQPTEYVPLPVPFHQNYTEL